MNPVYTLRLAFVSSQFPKILVSSNSHNIHHITFIHDIFFSSYASSTSSLLNINNTLSIPTSSPDQCEPTDISPLSPLDLTSSSTESNSSTLSSQSATTHIKHNISSSRSVISKAQQLSTNTIESQLTDFTNSTTTNDAVRLFENHSLECSINLDHEKIDLNVGVTQPMINKTDEDFSNNSHVNIDDIYYQSSFIKSESDITVNNSIPPIQNCKTTRRSRKCLSITKRSESPNFEDFLKTQDDISFTDEDALKKHHFYLDSGNDHLSSNNKTPSLKSSYRRRRRRHCKSKSDSNKYICKTSSSSHSNSNVLITSSHYGTRSKSRESFDKILPNHQRGRRRCTLKTCAKRRFRP